LAKYKTVREDFYAILRPIIVPKPNTIAWPPELHGSEFLPGKPDETKLEILAGLVDIINRYRLEVVRVGMLDYHGMPSELRGQPSAIYRHCWSDLIAALAGPLAAGMVIPVADMMPEKLMRQISQSAVTHNVIRAAGFEDMLSIRNTENLVGDVLFADSASNSGIQLADTIGYLLNVMDLADHKQPLTGFKEQQLELARRIDPALLTRRYVKLQEVGKS
jgi:hypothetical protein